MYRHPDFVGLRSLRRPPGRTALTFVVVAVLAALVPCAYADTGPLSKYTPPSDPAQPRVLVNLLVSIFLGTLLGVGLALVLELFSRRVRSSEDLADLPNLPLLGQLNSAKRAIKLAGAGASA